MRLKRKDGSQVSELFVDHKTEDSHHGGTSVVELDGTLLHLLFLIEIIPSVIDGSGAEISDEFTGSGVVTHDEFQNQDEGDKLDLSSLRDGSHGGGSGRDVGEGCSGEINVTRKTDSGVFDEESNNGKHGNTSVLQLGVSELVETFLGNVVEHTKRIEESKWWLGSKLILEGLEGGGGSLLLDRGERSGGGNEGCENGGLHGD
mmetsp:Transcript_58324/g.138798  ORF Transcript_58324/g.138798 Transcript_58324/m.138798 type:complete len:203 (-) Transcript_58324:29-637(-)